MTFNIKVSRHLRIPPFGLSNQQRFGLASLAIAQIRQRTALGLDMNDRPAPPLSRNYQRRKVRLGLPGIPDLRLTGAMMKSLQVQSLEPSVTIGFTGARNILKAGVNQGRRRQLGISDKDADVLRQQGYALLRENIRWSFGAIRRSFGAIAA